MKSISAIHPTITENTENALVKRAPQRLIIGKPLSQYASFYVYVHVYVDEQGNAMTHSEHHI